VHGNRNAYVLPPTGWLTCAPRQADARRTAWVALTVGDLDRRPLGDTGDDRVARVFEVYPALLAHGQRIARPEGVQQLRVLAVVTLHEVLLDVHRQRHIGTSDAREVFDDLEQACFLLTP